MLSTSLSSPEPVPISGPYARWLCLLATQYSLLTPEVYVMASARHVLDIFTHFDAGQSELISAYSDDLPPSHKSNPSRTLRADNYVKDGKVYVPTKAATRFLSGASEDDPLCDALGY